MLREVSRFPPTSGSLHNYEGSMSARLDKNDRFSRAHDVANLFVYAQLQEKTKQCKPVESDPVFKLRWHQEASVRPFVSSSSTEIISLKEISDKSESMVEETVRQNKEVPVQPEIVLTAMESHSEACASEETEDTRLDETLYDDIPISALYSNSKTRIFSQDLGSQSPPSLWDCHQNRRSSEGALKNGPQPVSASNLFGLTDALRRGGHQLPSLPSVESVNDRNVSNDVRPAGNTSMCGTEVTVCKTKRVLETKDSPERRNSLSEGLTTPKAAGAAKAKSKSIIDKKEMRALRNRESARRSRLKSKIHFQMMESTYIQMRNENKALKNLVEKLLPRCLERAPNLKGKLQDMFNAPF